MVTWLTQCSAIIEIWMRPVSSNGPKSSAKLFSLLNAARWPSELSSLLGWQSNCRPQHRPFFAWAQSFGLRWRLSQAPTMTRLGSFLARCCTQRVPLRRTTEGIEVCGNALQHPQHPRVVEGDELGFGIRRRAQVYHDALAALKLLEPANTLAQCGDLIR